MIQIKEIVLYSHKGEKRVIPIQIGKVNIITGKSATGKSAIIQIIDYCFGSSRCDVPEGVIREKVSWFGLLLKLDSGEIFIARENPSASAFSTNKCFLLEGKSVQSPGTRPEQNTTIEAVMQYLTGKIGIGENLNIPPEGQTRRALAASFRNALIYCLQDQDLIASKSTLFHKQNEPFVPQSIKDTLPYFLGAIREDHLLILQDLDKANRHLSNLQGELKEGESIRGSTIGRAFSLVTEAKGLGLIENTEDPESVEEVRALLEKIKAWKPEASLFDNANAPDYLSIQNEIYETENSIHDLDERIQTAKHFASAADGFEGEAREQALRLESIGLFDAVKEEHQNCFFCSSKTSKHSNHYASMRDSITRLHQEINTVVKEQPKINEFVAKLNKQREALNQKLRKKNIELESVIKKQANARHLRDRNLVIGQVIGKISLWLESTNIASDDSQLKSQIKKWEEEIKRLNKLIDPTETREILESALNRIAQAMTIDSDKLKLEHSGNPVRFDLKDLTVVVDLEERPVPLKRIGSGENHVGYHLLAHLALHRHFVKGRRPVPRFLVLDQPSQVYYPPEKRDDTGSLKRLGDEDKEALKRMYKYIFDVVKTMDSEFQVIVLDHANLDDKEFGSHVVEEWRGNKALIPDSW